MNTVLLICGIVILLIVGFYIYLRLQDAKRARDYKNSPQFKSRRDEFIKRIDDKKKGKK